MAIVSFAWPSSQSCMLAAKTNSYPKLTVSAARVHGIGLHPTEIGLRGVAFCTTVFLSQQVPPPNDRITYNINKLSIRSPEPSSPEVQYTGAPKNRGFSLSKLQREIANRARGHGDVRTGEVAFIADAGNLQADAAIFSLHRLAVANINGQALVSH